MAVTDKGVGVDIPLPLAATLTAATAPAITTTQPYDATSGALAPTLPALSDLSVGQRVAVQKSAADTSANLVTLTCAGSDTFDSGATTLNLKVTGELRELSVVSVFAVKKWKVTGGNTPLSSLDTRNDGRYLSITSRGETPEAFGTVGAGDDTAAIAAAAAACAVNGGGDVVLKAGAGYIASALKLKSNCGIVGGAGTVLQHKAGATDHLISLYDNTQVLVRVRDLIIDGNSANQSNPVDAVNIDYTSNSILGRADLLNLYIHDVKNNGVTLGNNSRVKASRLWIYKADNYGMYLMGGDSEIDSVDVGQAGKDGWYIGGRGYQVTNVKSWYSGRLDGVGGGFVIADQRNTLVNAWSQDNMGHGFNVAEAGGGAIFGTTLMTAWSENDNAAGGSYVGFNLVNSTNALIQGRVNAYSGGRHGTPASGLAIDLTSTGNQVVLEVTNTSGDAVTGAGLGLNTVQLSGREGRTISATPGATYTPSIFSARTFALALTRNVTISNPASTPAGFKIRFVLTQDATGSRTLTFDTNFLTSWTPNAVANSVSAIEFESDGTHWIQASPYPSGGSGAGVADYGHHFGAETMGRESVSSSAVAHVAGSVYVMPFTAESNLTVSNLNIVTGGTAFTGTTLARLQIGTYVDGSSTFTPLAETADFHTALTGAATGTILTQALANTARLASTPTSLTLSAGTRYAIALVTVGTTAGTLRGNSALTGSLAAKTPAVLRFAGTGQTDAPTVATVTTAGTGTANWAYAFGS